MRAVLADRKSPDWWRAFAPEMQVYTTQMRPGANYTLLRTPNPKADYFLCFCRTSSCERAWPTAPDDIYRTNIRDAYVCWHVLAEAAHWRLTRN